MYLYSWFMDYINFWFDVSSHFLKISSLKLLRLSLYNYSIIMLRIYTVIQNLLEFTILILLKKKKKNNWNNRIIECYYINIFTIVVIFIWFHHVTVFRFNLCKSNTIACSCQMQYLTCLYNRSKILDKYKPPFLAVQANVSNCSSSLDGA